jgi:hypothetical protein
MNNLRTANTVKGVLIASLLALTFACGYGSNYSNPSGGGGGNAPAISQLNPNSATAGGAAFMMTVTGKNFATKAVVNWNNAAQTTTYVSSTQLTISVPASMIASSGTAQVTVTNPGTTGIYGVPAQTSAAVSFTIN